MIEVATILYGIKTFGEALVGISGAWGLAKKGRDGYQANQIQQMLDALKLVYFPPDKTLSVLQKALVHDPETAKEAAWILQQYDRTAHEVNDALHALHPGGGFLEPDLPIAALQAMNQIVYGKISLRRELRGILDVLARGQPYDSNTIAQIVVAIEKLNDTVNALDKSLREQL